MCDPGIAPAKTDQQLAQEARRHLQGLLVATRQLSRRGYMTWMRSGSGCSVGWPETLEIKKEISL